MLPNPSSNPSSTGYIWSILPTTEYERETCGCCCNTQFINSHYITLNCPPPTYKFTLHTGGAYGTVVTQYVCDNHYDSYIKSHSIQR